VIRGKAEGLAATKLMYETGSRMKARTAVKSGREKETPREMK